MSKQKCTLRLDQLLARAPMERKRYAIQVIDLQNQNEILLYLNEVCVGVKVREENGGVSIAVQSNQDASENLQGVGTKEDSM